MNTQAPPSGSTQRQATGLGRIFRGAFATRGGSNDGDGSGAPAVGRKGLLIGALALAIAVAIVASAFGAKGVVKAIGTSSSGVTGGLFNTPRGMAVNTSGNGAPAGTLYVIDTNNNRVQRFDSTGTFVSAFGKDVQGAGVNLCTVAASCTEGTAAATAGAFGSNGAQGVAVEQTNGNVYVTDQVNRRVDVFSATGTFEGAFGWKVNATTPEEKLQLCTTATGCQVGSTGSNAGQFGAAVGYAAIAPAGAPNEGHVFIANKTSRRVDEFGPTLTAGEVTGIAFVRGYGWGASSGAAEFQVCTATCVAPAATGAAQGQFSSNAPSELGVDSAGNVYALDAGNNRVQKFSSTGTPIDSSFASGQLATSPAPADLYVNPTASGHVFVEKSNGTEVRTLELNTAGALLETHASGAAISSTTGVTLDSGNGNIYVATGNRILVLNTPLVPPTPTINPVTTFTAHTAELTGSVNPNGFETTYHFEISPDGTTWTKVPASDVAVGSGSSAVAVSQNAAGLLPNTLYRVKLAATKPFGAGTTTTSQVTFTTTAIAPSAEAFATEVEREEARLGAEINPNGTATTYQFEYVDDAHYQPLEANPYAEGAVKPASPEAIGSGTSNVVVSQIVEGLSPATTYHYRVVATNGIGSTPSPDHTITTPPVSPELDTSCPNQAFRNGASANLPDCRAYEMVSPIEKNGADIVPGGGPDNYFVGVEQSTPEGDKFAYTSSKSFDAQTNLLSNQYIASRGAAGWSTQAISPRHEDSVFNEPGYALIFQPGTYTGFTEDLSTGFLYDDGRPPLTADAIYGYYNNFLFDTRSGSYTAMTTQLRAPEEGLRNLDGSGFMGFSKDAGHTLFAAAAPLTPDAHPGDQSQLYDYHDGELELVSVLPNGEATANGANAGAAGGSPDVVEQIGETRNAISEDGSRIFWTTAFTSVGAEANTGSIYVRIDGERTVPVSGSVPFGNNAAYWGAAADGSRAVFVAHAPTGASNLYRFDVDSETPTLIAGGVSQKHGVLGVSEDASHVYFLSSEVLAPGASAGQPNLYLDDEGAKTFIATLAPDDQSEGGGNYGVASNTAVSDDFSDVTANGRYLVFQSLASLTGYDNTGLGSGDPATEIYRYDSVSEELECISCNPSGARPQTGVLFRPNHVETGVLPPYGGFAGPHIQAAAWLPTPRRATQIPRMVGEDGSYVFFNAFDALVPGDTNGTQDVYEWEAQGTAGCEKQGGCISLISTATSEEKSTFIEASRGGHDVFFRTTAGIDPEDPGLVDIYDARVDGGFERPTPPPACLGDACQSVPAAPNDPTPASAGFRGAGNPVPRKPRKSCRARSRHLKQGGKAKQKKAKRCKRHNRRAGR